MSRPSRFGVLLLAFGVVACGGETGEMVEGEEEETAAAGAAAASDERRVEIVRPADGDTVEGPAVEVRLAAHGFTVVPAGDTTPNSGHHHIFLDRDVSPPGEPIPTEAGHIMHMGDGSSTFVFDSVASGPHRLITVVGDAIHAPVPGLRDTVEFTVR
ncbi:MAG: DUF4399 domain-containing protein [Gemmatimonadetes bacterium]|nr:DUF4399 domain-containing protein [Gemmatimonadota bacterium]NIR79908.1 DUF4399 domain-containing protein [Gemmatimonadota bacterium]NIT88627.1 DUF4399 domain-containing protein [Gemmatimonadota bacterium]NIU32442.1 DUF4399 domain-containing protein [Gemmatimonadota bacterium]NIU36938.1 DUF4399 domain-containing protein [Gemmatimonadota bacterium]